MESSGEQKIIVEQNLTDDHVVVDFSLLMGGDEDLENDDDSRETYKETSNVLMSDDSDSGDDENDEDIDNSGLFLYICDVPLGK